MRLNPTKMNIQELRGTVICVRINLFLFFRINLTIKITLLHREGIISISRRANIEPEKIWAQKTVCIELKVLLSW